MVIVGLKIVSVQVSMTLLFGRWSECVASSSSLGPSSWNKFILTDSPTPSSHWPYLFVSLSTRERFFFFPTLSERTRLLQSMLVLAWANQWLCGCPSLLQYYHLANDLSLTLWGAIKPITKRQSISSSVDTQLFSIVKSFSPFDSFFCLEFVFRKNVKLWNWTARKCLL